LRPRAAHDDDDDVDDDDGGVWSVICQEFVIGMKKGTSSLVRNVVSGTLKSAAGLGDTVNSAVASLAFDRWVVVDHSWHTKVLVQHTRTVLQRRRTRRRGHLSPPECDRA
jgi:hypothetical protein